jgi:hypothetical protein
MRYLVVPLIEHQIAQSSFVPDVDAVTFPKPL